jgi:uncharacterized protein YbjQ (UPF0145 family)
MKYLVLFLVIYGCAGDPTRKPERAESIQIFTVRPAMACEVIGKVKGIDRQGSRELALNRAIQAARKLGATGIVINQEVPNGPVITVHATAYNCEN